MSTSIAYGSFLFLFIFVVFIQSSSSLICYNCDDCSLTTCKCDKTKEIDTASNYCIIEQENNDASTNIYLKNIARNATINYVNDPFYILFTETIRFNEITQKWITDLDKIIFGCHTDKCNRPGLVQALSKSIVSFSLPEEWLNENIRRKPGVTSTVCHNCPDDFICSNTEQSVNMSRCPEEQCQGFCAVTNKIGEPNSPTEFCYQSICVNDSSIFDSHRITIDLIYHLNTKKFDFWKIDIYCQAENCSRLEIFQDIKNKLQKAIDPAAFFTSISSFHSSSILLLSIVMFIHLLKR